MKTQMLAGICLALCVAAGIQYAQYLRSEAALTPERAAAEVLASIDGEINLAELPLSQAIKQVHGNGSLALVTFEDPNCPYCAKLDAKLARLDDATLYTFLFPILSEDSDLKSRSIWCAQDPAAAWNDWMLRRRLPVNAGDCDASALARNLEIGEKLGIRGVPYLLRAKK
ncbi:MAG: DsbC family protein [Azoarcus sp.]|jgi:thiol:disulfide interchange protein DsbC|nr:DsbC family protein [Azoarcus sp.]